MEQPRTLNNFNITTLFYLFLDASVFITLAIVGAYIIDKIIPRLQKKETVKENLFWLFSQFLISVIYIYVIASTYESITKRSVETYFALSIFIVTFFLAQGEMQPRLAAFFREAGGNVLGREKSFIFA